MPVGKKLVWIFSVSNTSRHPVNTDTLAKLAVGDDRQVSFVSAFRGKAAPIFLLQCVWSAEVFRPGLRRRRKGVIAMRAPSGHLDRFPFRF